MCTGEGCLGLVHETAKEGDLLICILCGCSVLVVLRRFEKTAAQTKKKQAEDEWQLERLKKEAVDKIRTACLARLKGIRNKKLEKGKCINIKSGWAGRCIGSIPDKLQFLLYRLSRSVGPVCPGISHTC